MNIKNFLAILSIVLFAVFVAGLVWLAGVEAPQTSKLGFMLLLAYAAGLSMIILPCTLPLAFIIVPLCAGKEYKKGFLMAVLFGLGLTITITIYGILMAFLGRVLGLGAATPIILFIAGIAAYAFGISEAGIYTMRLPFMEQILPESIQKKGDYTKSFFLGLLLGNAGVGCPNPLFYVLLLYIAGTGDLLTGGIVGFVHGFGRATPIILLSILAMLGISSLGFISSKRFAIKNITGWSLIVIGAFLLTTGLFNLRGWWILQPSTNISPLLVTLALLFLAFLLKTFTKNKSKTEG